MKATTTKVTPTNLFDTSKTDVEYIDNVIDTAGKISNGENTVSDFLVEVSDDKLKRTKYIQRLNHLNNTLANEDLTAFKKKVHKIVKITNKKKTQERILGTEKCKTTKWSIRLAKTDDVDKGLALETQKGTYKEFMTPIEPTPEKKPETLADTIANWLEANEPESMAKDKRKPFNDDVINSSQMLIQRVLLIKGK